MKQTIQRLSTTGIPQNCAIVSIQLFLFLIDYYWLHDWKSDYIYIHMVIRNGTPKHNPYVTRRWEMWRNPLIANLIIGIFVRRLCWYFNRQYK